MAEVLSRLFFAGFVRLHVLYHAAQEPICGVEIVAELGRHGYRLSPGTVYPVLHELERAGYLTSRAQVVSRKRRRYYEATAQGRDALAAAKDKLRELAAEVLGTPEGHRRSAKRPEISVARHFWFVLWRMLVELPAKEVTMKAGWTVLGLLIVSLVAPATSLAADDEAYRRPELLMEPLQLAKPDVAKQYVVLDARDHTKYQQGHVPNARWVDHQAWAKAFDHGKDAEGWGKRISELGIGSDTKVVTYDDNDTKDAARIWWLLRYWGAGDVRLLNGGWKAWETGKHALETTEVVPTPAQFVAKAQTVRLATKEQLLASLQGSTIQIVDARSEKEFCGVEKLTNKRAGAIPGAKQLEWIDLIDSETHCFKSAADLRKLFEQAGIDLDRPTATHCQSGGRAAVMAFGLELMGAKEVSNYYPSWAEWGNALDTPVVPGKIKEKNQP